ncbi:T9SS type A sorting domain-containing protein [Hymenobacter sp. BRD128]|uniref:T9SS type A sorting domain-containing protein n=1 Tax=Hymenobacter sp. BRD128 TaxID=2675878 RepID=UPI001567A035|nr:T9SS type A sorting domain-containing protein [Hymenobacter sp. BRD128]QKG56064.1 T9SS type A sorting domain-containing protein [Hymenobacter sp. BRD128]
MCIAAPQLLRAQGCLLAPVALSQRTQQAALVVEARVASQQVEDLNGHLVTRNVLEVFKVFRGPLPGGPLSLLTPGGTLGLRREEVSSSLQLTAGQQGIFFLEADPNQPGERRAYAGPQGFIGYDLTDLTASEPFGRYASIGQALYEAVQAGTGTAYRTVAANTSLAAATQLRRLRAAAGPLATTAPVISSFSPSAVTVGTTTATTTSPTGVLTITGTGFGSTQGAGYVQFRNADDGGASYIKPLASDYLSWSDTQIQVRVPANGTSPSTPSSPAGTGDFQVADNGGALATSPSPLTVTYALLTTVSNGQPYRIHLISPDNSGGYTLQYAASFPAAAKAPFERALQNWRCQGGINRTISATAAPNDVTSKDGVNVVRFDATLSTGVLGVTYQYYYGCSVSNGPLNWQAIETDYAYAPVPIPATSTAPAYTWNYTTSTPSGQQYDFESVALHEEGHGAQLAHIISATGVMNYAIGNGQTRRTLDTNSDIAAGQNVRDYSTGATALERCNYAAFTAATCPLPVQLAAFSASYQPSQGTLLSWITASELNSAAFVVESQDDPAAAAWQAVAQEAAAGTSATPRQYQARDARPLAGTRYYRLRQVDQDRQVTYSPVVSVSATATRLAAYPNPATGTVHLSGPLAPGTAAQVRLLDATGRCVASATGPAGQAAFDLPLAGVPAGVYVAEWNNGVSLSRQRVVVQ